MSIVQGLSVAKALQVRSNPAKVKFGSNQAQYHFVAMNLIGIAKLLARGVGQFHAAVYMLAGVDLEGLEFHYDVERIDCAYIVGEVGADTE